MATKKQTPLRRLSYSERAAHNATGGAMPAGLPLEHDEIIWKKVGIGQDEAVKILDAVAYCAGRYYEREKELEARLTPTEIIAQAHDTAALCDALRERIEHMEPTLAGVVSGAAYQAYGDLNLDRAGLQWLTQLSALLRRSAVIVKADSDATPTKRTAHRDALLSALVDALAAHAEGVPAGKRKSVAARLLRVSGISAPRSKAKQDKALRKSKSP